MKRSECLVLRSIDKEDRLLQAALDAWCRRGTSELSARSIGAIAELSPSAIYYHYDDLEHLYVAAQEHAIAAAGKWCGAQLSAMGTLGTPIPLPPEALGPAMATLIDSFCEQERRLAFAWRECQTMATRSSRFLPAQTAWCQLWQDFWRQICARFALEDCADLTYYFFEGESLLHLMRWNRVADRASLDEMATGWVGWLTGQVRQSAPWRRTLKDGARHSVRLMDEPNASGGEIARAAVMLLIDGGVGAITHRAVAARTNKTLGVVSHNCRRTDDLLRLAYGEIYRTLTGGLSWPPQVNAPANIRPLSALPARSQMLAMDELILGVARGRADSDLAQQLRYLRGATSRLAIADFIDIDTDAGNLIAAIFSSIMMGALRAMAHLAEKDANSNMTVIRYRLEEYLKRNRDS